MKFTAFILLALILHSCDGGMEGIPKPSDLIPRDTMVKVLQDLTLIESHIQRKLITVDQYKSSMIFSGNAILRDHHLSQERFERSMDYYGSRQEIMRGIYSEILDSLNTMALKYSPENLYPTDSSTISSGLNIPAPARPH